MSDLQFPPCPAPFNLAHYVLCHATPSPDKVALEILGSKCEIWHYGALVSAVRGVASGLLARGLRPGDIILLRLGNTPDFPIAYLGAIAAGMIACPTSSALSVDEITKMAASIDPAAILQDDAIARPSGFGNRTIHLTELQNMYDLPAADWHMGDPERAAYMVFTSGTSGKPKAVIHAHRAIWARRMMHADWEDLRQEDRLLHAGAFNWTYTLGTGLMDPWSLGATALIPQDGTPIDAIAGLLSQHKATIFAAAPGVYRKMLKEPLPKFTELRHGLSAGEKMSQNLHETWQDQTGTKVYEAFGMSECSTFISSNPHQTAPTNALGRAQRGRQITLRNKSGKEVAQGEIGTIAIHRTDPGLMLGYHGAQSETQERFQGEWFLSGDLAHEDTEGVFSYHGRSDDMMNAGGFRVSPIEVEAAFSTLDAISQCAALEIMLKADTTVIVLCYLARGDVHESTLQALATQKLARYKRPRIFHQCETLPLSANGKLLRRVLRSQIEAHYDQA